MLNLGAESSGLSSFRLPETRLPEGGWNAFRVSHMCTLNARYSSSAPCPESCQNTPKFTSFATTYKNSTIFYNAITLSSNASLANQTTMSLIPDLDNQPSSQASFHTAREPSPPSLPTFDSDWEGWSNDGTEILENS
jgi:hypothetical protein